MPPRARSSVTRRPENALCSPARGEGAFGRLFVWGFRRQGVSGALGVRARLGHAPARCRTSRCSAAIRCTPQGALGDRTARRLAQGLGERTVLLPACREASWALGLRWMARCNKPRSSSGTVRLRKMSSPASLLMPLDCLVTARRWPLQSGRLREARDITYSHFPSFLQLISKRPRFIGALLTLAQTGWTEGYSFRLRSRTMFGTYLFLALLSPNPSSS